MFTMQPIGYVRSCYKEKFGIPRQPGLVTEARAVLQLLPEYADPEAVRGLAGFSHVWLIFIFHVTATAGWKASVRPPRLGGNKRRGVFATRSMFRPNPLGLSVVSLSGIRESETGVELELAGVDLLDGTPVLDIKPYLPYAEKLDEATGGFAPSAPVQELPVVFSTKASAQCSEKAQSFSVDINALITRTLAQDPRPSYRRNTQDDRVYGMRLYDFDVRWYYDADKIKVLELVDVC